MFIAKPLAVGNHTYGPGPTPNSSGKLRRSCDHHLHSQASTMHRSTFIDSLVSAGIQLAISERSTRQARGNVRSRSTANVTTAAGIPAMSPRLPNSIGATAPAPIVAV